MRIKDSIIEIKNNLQGNNRVDKAETQVNNLEHKEAKNNQSEQEEEKGIQKSKGSISCLWDNFKFHHLHHRGGRKRREGARHWKSI